MTQQSTLVQCHHCGDDIIGPSIYYHEHEFCCEGCKTVYSILESNGLCDYYALNDQAGFSLKSKSVTSYEYLDDEVLIDRLTKKISPDLSMVILSLPQIHCSSCVWLLEKLYKFNEGIFVSKIDFLKREIEVRYNPSKISFRNIVELLDNLGYKPDILVDQQTSTTYDSTLKIKIGVAGFVFGNVMLFSFPEYLGLEDEYFKQWFGYVNILLSIPVLFYSGKDYLKQAWQSLKYKTYNINIPLALGMVVMFLVSIIQIVSRTGAGYIDSLSGLIFFLLIGKWYQQRSYHYLSFERDYRSYFPISCAKIDDSSHIKEVSIDKIVSGDTLLIRNNQIIPVDSELLSSSANIDYSFVTGEEVPVVVMKGEKIYAGGKLKDKNVEVKALAKVKNSYLVSLWNSAVFNKDQDDVTPITDQLSKYFTITLLVIATASFAYWIDTSWDKAIMSFTSVLIVACPCAIALTVPFLYGNILRLLSKRGIFLKNSLVIEKSAQVDHVVFDKTGTITTQLDKELHYEGKYLSKEEKSLIHALAFQSSHPLSIVIEKELRGEIILQITDFKEEAGLGIEGICEGRLIKIGSAKFLNIADSNTNETIAYVSIDNRLIGHFTFSNQYRENLDKVIHSLKQQRKQMSVLSGDNDREKSKLIPLFGGTTTMLFNKDPHDKLSYIQQLQSNHKVAMIGDGLNDAGALKQSDLGIVITESNNNFTPSCDMIMRSDNFGQLGSYFQLTKQSRYLVAGAYFIAILYNYVGLSYAVRAELSPIVAAILMPLSSVTIVLYTVLSSGWLVNQKMKS